MNKIAVKIPFNILIVIMLVFAMIGLYFLSGLGVGAGADYLWLLIIGVVFILIAFGANRLGKDFWFEIPINKTNEKATLTFFLGIIIILLLKGISSLFSLNIYSPFFMSPLASFSGDVGYQSFTALQAVTSDFWTFFITVISASVIEELVLGFAFVVMGALIFGYGVRKLLKFDFGEKGNEWWDFIMAMLFSIVMFSVLHIFNSTYTSVNMFIYAAVFRLILNVFIYKFGNFGLMFSIGVHATNNALFLGLGVVQPAMFSFPGGILLGLFLAMLVYFAIISFKTIKDEGINLGKDFMSFD